MPEQPAARGRSFGRRRPAVGTDYFLLREQLSSEELGYLERTRRFVEDEVLPVIGDQWARAEFPLDLARRLGELGPVGIGSRATAAR